MPQQRTIHNKISDTLIAYNVFSETLTPEIMRNVLGKMTEAQQAADVGDVQAYAALVQASIVLQRVIATNDRAALQSAVQLAQSGVSRPVIDINDGIEE